MKLIKKFVDFVVLGIGKIHWKTKREISAEVKNEIREMLGPNYYVMLTHRSNHLSTFFVGLSNFVLTGKWGYWAHAFMNVENEVASDSDFRIVEAVGSGTQYTPFDKVFDVQGVALLKPKKMTAEEWTAVLDRATGLLGRPYDSLFDLKSDSSLSCVELVRTALMAEPNYAEDFAEFEKMIQKRKNLTPQMFYQCPDFEVVFERRV